MNELIELSKKIGFESGIFSFAHKDMDYLWMCELQKYLRSKLIHVNVQSSELDSWFDIYEDRECIMEVDNFDSPEQALQQGLIEAIKVIL